MYNNEILCTIKCIFLKLAETNFICILYDFENVLVFVCGTWKDWGAMDMRRELKVLTWGVGWMGNGKWYG